MAHKGSPRPGQSAWSDELRDAFLALLRETGNASASARALGHPNLFNNRRQRDPAFRRDCAAAVAEADAKLGRVPSAFPEPAERKVAPRRPMTGDEIGDYLKPGRKRPQARPEPVIRRTANGRAQITFAQEGHWTSEIEADFLDRLSLGGNFEASARAVGFHPSAVMYRVHKWPAFSRACDEAINEASKRLDYALVAHAHALLRRPGEAREEDEADIPFDPKAAMQILGFIDARRAGRTGRGRRKGPPERSFEEAVENVLQKVEAIKNHKANDEEAARLILSFAAPAATESIFSRRDAETRRRGEGRTDPASQEKAGRTTQLQLLSLSSASLRLCAHPISTDE